MRRVGRVARGAMVVALVAPWSVSRDAEGTGGEAEFERIATFVVCENTSCDRDEVESTVSEIVTASADGRTLVYADGALHAIGFVDITDPEHAAGPGRRDARGSPTSVAVAGPWLLAAVDTSASFTEPERAPGRVRPGRLRGRPGEPVCRWPRSTWAASRTRSPSAPTVASRPSPSRTSATRR